MFINKNNNINLVKNFGNYHYQVTSFIQQLYKNSIKYYNDTYHQVIPLRNQKKELEQIKNAVTYVADYLYYFYRIYPDNFLTIYNCLKQNLKVITVFPLEKRGLYGERTKDMVYFNPELRGSYTLTSNERIRLYVNHELGHIINEQWMLQIERFLNVLQDDICNKQLVYDGFSLLDEAITQNWAEDITYHSLGKKRPLKVAMQHKDLFDKQIYQTNYDFYGELQTPATVFAQTLRGLGDKYDSVALKKLCERALNLTFSLDIVEEYHRDGQSDNFYRMFHLLGGIKNASYATFGKGDRRYLKASKELLSQLLALTEKLRDVRPPLQTRPRR